MIKASSKSILRRSYFSFCRIAGGMTGCFGTGSISHSHHWKKHENNPLVGGERSVFDASVLREEGIFQMWASLRDLKSIGLFESSDGVKWNFKRSILSSVKESGWEEDVNRPSVIKKDLEYHLWYTGQAGGRSRIGYATSADGVNWTRKSQTPVLLPDQPWEKDAVMCPHVLWDSEREIFRMWYSGGEQYEPDAVGYATSTDGIVWHKHSSTPIFCADRSSQWEKSRVTAMHVLKTNTGHYGFYIGFADNFEKSYIGLARSDDGVTGWRRFPKNPIIAAGEKGSWDDCNVYKPCVVRDQGRWMVWYNASRRSDRREQIGLATCADLDFPLF